MEHALVIGGTGMLKNVCHYLLEFNYTVSAVGRNPGHHQRLRLASTNPENYHAILVDYHDDAKLKSELNIAFQRYGTPSIVVSWIHSSAPQALPLIIDEIQRRNSSFPWRLFHIQGSAGIFEKENTPVPENCRYRRVFLGFVFNGKQSRWLTHNEIASGVIQAIERDQAETIVGTLEPWDKRP